MKIYSAVIVGANVLKDKSILSAQLDTEILLAKALNKNREYIILNHDRVLNNKNLENFKKLVHERATRKPIAYLLNKKFFWKSEFYVNKNTLIPRPDTEILLEQILKLTKNKHYLRILDIGVGSGCILLSILNSHPTFDLHSLDRVHNPCRTQHREESYLTIRAHHGLANRDAYKAHGLSTLWVLGNESQR